MKSDINPVRNAKRNAAVITAVILLLLVCSLTAIYVSSLRDENARYARIYRDGRLIKTIDLNNAENGYTFTVTGTDGCFNTIMVKDGSIGVIGASCPDGLCMNMGFVSSSAIPVTCLPNHMVIELSHDPATDEFDGVAY